MSAHELIAFSQWLFIGYFALLNAGYHPIDMANFMARPEGATSACLKEVAESDLFVGIYAWRYGFIPPDSEVSITEQEYLEAEKLGKPRFCFVVDENYDWPEEYREKGIGARLLRDFKARLDATLVRTTFTTPEDLAGKVIASLHRWQKEQSDTQTAEASAPSTGGINISDISGSNVNLGNVITGNVGGDVVGGDRISGDKVGSSKITDTVPTQDVAVTELRKALVQWQKEIEAKVNTLSHLDDDEKEDLRQSVGRVAKEAAKGPQAEPGKIERWLNTIGAMAPDILDVTAATLQSPFKGVGLVLQKISDRVKLERQE